MARIDIVDLCKRFGNIEVISNVNLSFEEGEFIVLVGPSGCGKSTLLRMIAGLESITKGDIIMNDQRVNDLPPRDRNIAMVFQSYALYPHMNVERNMGFSMEIKRTPPDTRRQHVDKAAAILGLGSLMERLPKALSGGQRQRVAMGRAIVRDPSAFLFDEPLSNLDAALRVEMRLEIARLHQRLGSTMVYVTHDQVEALTLADRIVVLDHGVVQQVGTPMELYESPANRFVARFIGSPTMNLIEVAMEDQQLTMKSTHSAIPLPALVGAESATQLGIRPEHLEPMPAGKGHVQGEVEVVERLGSDSFVYVQVPGAGRLLSRCNGNTRLQAGEAVGLSLDPAHLHLFDEKGQALR
ncbi:MAG: sn-glycerol-3-phosphate ABC transporter ATP-binding protein UgpC [Granulosicoccus sp.]|nr:sn-glycerol-3-phosphate ABC transporter ATP-binding protein UgpC [Granulosicoccus sp.]